MIFTLFINKSTYIATHVRAVTLFRISIIVPFEDGDVFWNTRIVHTRIVVQPSIHLCLPGANHVFDYAPVSRRVVMS